MGERKRCRYCRGGHVALAGHEENCVMRPPKGYRFDAFADVRMGKSLFEMRDEDWLITDGNCESER